MHGLTVTMEGDMTEHHCQECGFFFEDDQCPRCDPVEVNGKEYQRVGYTPLIPGDEKRLLLKKYPIHFVEQDTYNTRNVSEIFESLKRAVDRGSSFAASHQPKEVLVYEVLIRPVKKLAAAVEVNDCD
jgi:hypothetical protein